MFFNKKEILFFLKKMLNFASQKYQNNNKKQ